MTDVKRIRYEELGYVCLNVSDLDQSVAFYVDIVGLNLISRSGDTAYFGLSDDRVRVALTQGTSGFKRVGWKLENEESFGIAAERFERSALGMEVVSDEECELFGNARAFRIRQPHTGATFEFCLPDRARAYKRFQRKTAIERLGHVALAAPDFDGFESWMNEVCNFEVSDRVGGRSSLMRCPPNPFHHSFGVAFGQTPRFHHLNFMVRSLDDVGQAYNRMKAHGARVVFGPGRHPTSNSVFLYFLDPDDLTLEFSQGMELFPEGVGRLPREMPNRLESLDAWGGKPSAGYASTGVIEE